MSSSKEIEERQKAPLRTPSDIGPQAVKEITGALNALLADIFGLYLKTKDFHWHMSGPIFATIISFLMSMATNFMP
jgi:starvation-inducible DNA-binding protein